MDEMPVQVRTEAGESESPHPVSDGWCARFLTSTFEFAQSESRIVPMEGLHGLAVLLVLLVHHHAVLSPYLPEGNWLTKLSLFGWSIGHSGVDLFFVLSGYLIYGAVIRRPTSTLKYLKRRVERIYPVFICIFVIYLLLSHIFPDHSRIPSGPFAVVYLLENFFLLPGMMKIVPFITVAWSLSYEFCFYLLTPAVVTSGRMRTWHRRYRVLFVITIGATLCALNWYHLASQIRLLMFCSGIILYETANWKPLQKKLCLSGELAVIALFVLSLVAVSCLELRVPWIRLPGYPYSADLFRSVLLSATMFLLTLYCFQFDGLLKRCFAWTPLRWLGNMSYSYYLSHGLVLLGVGLAVSKLLHKGTHSLRIFLVVSPIAILLTIVFSTMLFILVEKPFSLQTRPVRLPHQVEQAGSGLRMGEEH